MCKTVNRLPGFYRRTVSCGSAVTDRLCSKRSRYMIEYTEFENTKHLTEEEKIRMGSYLRELRDEKNVSQEKLSEVIDCSPQYISDVERGKYSLSLKKVMLVCEKYNISSDRLIFGSPDKFSEFDSRSLVMRLIEDLNSEQIGIVIENLRILRRAFGIDH